MRSSFEPCLGPFVLRLHWFSSLHQANGWPFWLWVLFVTHNPLLAQRCDKTIEVIDGRVGGA
jgi:hypothetical protein